MKNLNQTNSTPFAAITSLPLLLILAIVLLAPALARAQQYSIDWFSIDGGGGTSTGGVYQVTGTIGQPDAGAMSGGNYTLTGGFWSLISVLQTPGAPLLTIQRATNNTVVVFWPSPSTGFNLQENTNLATTNWTAVAQTPNDDGTIKSVVVAPSAFRVYRLKK
jgi:hypothetical protein